MRRLLSFLYKRKPAQGPHPGPYRTPLQSPIQERLRWPLDWLVSRWWWFYVWFHPIYIGSVRPMLCGVAIGSAVLAALFASPHDRIPEPESTAAPRSRVPMPPTPPPVNDHLLICVIHDSRRMCPVDPFASCDYWIDIEFVP